MQLSEFERDRYYRIPAWTSIYIVRSVSNTLIQVELPVAITARLIHKQRYSKEESEKGVLSFIAHEGDKTFKFRVHTQDLGSLK